MCDELRNAIIHLDVKRMRGVTHWISKHEPLALLAKRANRFSGTATFSWLEGSSTQRSIEVQ
jgi:hypothetical protein